MDGCAAIWPVWGALPYYLEEARLIRDFHKPPPRHWRKREFRLAAVILNLVERVKGGPD